MAKRYRKDYSKDEVELEQLQKDFKEDVTEDGALKTKEEKLETQPEEQLTSEELTFKKRYGDLRSYAQKKEQELQQQIDELKKSNERLEQSVKEQISLPDVSSKEEAEAWIKKYPDLAKVFRYLAVEQDLKVKEEIGKTQEELKRIQFEKMRSQAYMTLLELHPDFDNIKNDQDFVDWLRGQSQKYQDALWKNIDPHEAAFVIDIYKAQKIKNSKPSEKEQKKKDEARAAETVGRPTSNAGPTDEGEPKLSESYIEKMTKKDKNWFDKNHDKVMAAIRSGKFEYDLTGAAR